jgi:hypothetical protein
MHVLFHPRRGPAVLGATVVLLVITLVSTGFSRPSYDSTPAPDSRSLAVAEAQQADDDAQPGTARVARADTVVSGSDTGPSWLAFGLVAGGALLAGVAAGAATTAALRPARSPGVSP